MLNKQILIFTSSRHICLDNPPPPRHITLHLAYPSPCSVTFFMDGPVVTSKRTTARYWNDRSGQKLIIYTQ